ncbi:hypothetical protein BU24DRAFT_428447 [Aaosphaeria arxii CBS 175.79]|uniref:Post-SET domain-containing protein n=1 Tax=Aaosphaeria arxii CBS 175.79 TaxID=1450172 RepID=A0A6A5X9B5_9PLEO|nr:uncharacterized protein BU24DRAFT_428447 [Aaosphaeria arxii CBS 175.79]KAF2009552.1 hypothetical protein BU24DRAFT_428447 [Aaosphaeria arxii CBS 175.79]
MPPAAIIDAAPAAAPNGKQQSIVSSVKSVIAPSSSIADNSTSVPAWVKPDLTRLLRVEHLEGSFASRSISLVDLPAGAVFARITNPTPATCAYTSVQASKDLHIELNSDLVYINHSCNPTLIFDMPRWEVRVNPDRAEGLKAGEELTFFYPSTEWDMSQPFDCRCKESNCQGAISGAKTMPADVLSKYWLAPHIESLLKEQRSIESNGNGSKNSA